MVDERGIEHACVPTLGAGGHVEAALQQSDLEPGVLTDIYNALDWSCEFGLTVRTGDG
jgi:hypothetical protein